MQTFEAINSDPSALLVSAPKSSKGGLKIGSIHWNKKLVRVKLAQNLSSVSTPFAPSVFGGGDADRKGILFNIPNETYEQLYEFESNCLKALKEHVPNIFEIWRTAITPEDKYSATLKAKINTRGDNKVTYYNSEYEVVEEPASWRKLPVNASIIIKGCYVQRGQAGFLIDVTHLQYGDAPDAQPQVCPFL
jgi:hypothetical protein